MTNFQTCLGRVDNKEVRIVTSMIDPLPDRPSREKVRGREEVHLLYFGRIHYALRQQPHPHYNSSYGEQCNFGSGKHRPKV